MNFTSDELSGLYAVYERFDAESVKHRQILEENRKNYLGEFLLTMNEKENKRFAQIKSGALSLLDYTYSNFVEMIKKIQANYVKTVSNNTSLIDALLNNGDVFTEDDLQQLADENKMNGVVQRAVKICADKRQINVKIHDMEYLLKELEQSYYSMRQLMMDEHTDTLEGALVEKYLKEIDTLLTQKNV